MDYVRLGSSGLEVSRICLGLMSYGEPDRGLQQWTLDERDSLPYFKAALEAGITFFDTANVYSAGSSEEITGRALKQLTDLDDVVLATKVHGRMRPGPNGGGLGRVAILREIDASLQRLGVDHVDLYQIHRFDPGVPVEETMEALHDVVRAGKARHLGASSMWAWQFALLQETAHANGWTPFVSMQDQYSLLMREEEREMLPLCEHTGVGVIPWSPLARGRLARDHGESTARMETDEAGKRLFSETDAGILAADRAIVDAVGEIAAARGVTRAQVALAWVLSKPVVTSPIVGATKPHHLDDAVAALDLDLTEEEVTALEAPYVPHRPTGYV